MAGRLSDELEQLETWVGGLLAKASPAERRQLARAVAVDLRRSQVERIRDQKNPDGTPYAPRKRRDPPIRAKAGRIKRRVSARAKPMFRKMRLGKHLQARWTEAEASVGFTGRAARIARVHQDGLRDRVEPRPDAPEVIYPKRGLVGFTDDDRQRLLDLVLAHLES